MDDFGFEIEYSADPFGELANKAMFFFGFRYYEDWAVVQPKDNPA